MSSEPVAGAIDGSSDEPWFIRDVRLQREASEGRDVMPAVRPQADRPASPRDTGVRVEHPEDSGGVPVRRTSVWPYAAGAAAALVIGGGLLYGSGSNDLAKPAETPSARARTILTATVWPTTRDPLSTTTEAVSRCATPAIIEDLRAAIGARAREAGATDARRLRANMARLSISGGAPASAAAAPGFEACTVRLSLWLPTVDGAPREIAASATYAIDSRAGGNARVGTVEGIGELIAQLSAPALTFSPTIAAADPLPGIARPATQPDLARPPAAPAVASPPAVVVEAPPAARAAPVAGSANPRGAAGNDFEGGNDRCGEVRTRAEYLVCSNVRLAALDDEVSALLAGIETNADPTTAGVAREDQARFLRFRDRCAETSCVSRVYRRRILDLRDFGYPRG